MYTSKSRINLCFDERWWQTPTTKGIVGQCFGSHMGASFTWDKKVMKQSLKYVAIMWPIEMMCSSNCFVVFKFYCDQGFHVEAEVLPTNSFVVSVCLHRSLRSIILSIPTCVLITQYSNFSMTFAMLPLLQRMPPVVVHSGWKGN